MAQDGWATYFNRSQIKALVTFTPFTSRRIKCNRQLAAGDCKVTLDIFSDVAHDPEHAVHSREQTARSFGVQRQQLLAESQVSALKIRPRR
jgi:hypothetical protein